MTSNETVADREWLLFSDWCISMDTSPMPTNAETIARFLDDLPAPASTQIRRVKAIKKAHESEGVEIDLDQYVAPRVIREGEGWATVSHAIARLPKTRFPVGLRGRRDAWVLALTGVLGFTRAEAQSVTEDEIVLFPDITIRGIPVPKDNDDAKRCPRCAVTRWLRISNLAAFGARADMLAMLDPTLSLDTHDCDTGLTGEWRHSPQLIPAIDQYGWVDNHQPISLRSISSIVAIAQSSAGPVEQEFVRREYNGRFKNATSQELADAYDDVDQKLKDLLDKIDEVGRVAEGNDNPLDESSEPK